MTGGPGALLLRVKATRSIEAGMPGPRGVNPRGSRVPGRTSHVDEGNGDAMRSELTTIFFPCPGCAKELAFTRDEARDLAITATCDRCVARYAMTPSGVHRVESDGPDATPEG